MAKNQDITIESSLPVVQINGLLTNKNAYLGGTLEVVGAATFDSTATFAGAQSSTGAITALSATTPTAPQLAVGFSNVATLGIYMGYGAPAGQNIAAATGSLYLNYTGTASTRLYSAVGGTAWGAITASA